MLHDDLKTALCPFDHAFYPNYTSFALGLRPPGRSKLRCKLFLRTFLSSRAPWCTFWLAQRADFLPIAASEHPYFAGKTLFARLRPHQAKRSSGGTAWGLSPPWLRPGTRPGCGGCSLLVTGSPGQRLPGPCRGDHLSPRSIYRGL